MSQTLDEEMYSVFFFFCSLFSVFAFAIGPLPRINKEMYVLRSIKTVCGEIVSVAVAAAANHVHWYTFHGPKTKIEKYYRLHADALTLGSCTWSVRVCSGLSIIPTVNNGLSKQKRKQKKKNPSWPHDAYDRCLCIKLKAAAGCVCVCVLNVRYDHCRPRLKEK